ncbi:MAG: cell division protein ZapA [Clostridia bacterium]|nr:cell division protein ZapA [Clostridia bacterium]
MKQKYTITVADMELNIISDASPDEVENIVGILDRRMRDINLKSPRCTKNEAAVLCALSYCSERIAMQEAFKKVEKDAFRFAGENEKLKKTIESMQEEMDNLRKDADVMRSILERASLTVAPQPAPQEEKPKYVPKPFGKKEEDTVQLSAFDAPVAQPEQPTSPVEPAVAATATEESSEETAESAVQKKNQKANKTRVGTMFDLLTFSDV